jgi:hypothetical protein
MTRLVEPRPHTMRRDPGPTNKTFFGFVAMPERGATPVLEPECSMLPGRLGHAERDLMVELVEESGNLHISLSGWYTDKVSLNDRQAIFLRNVLNRYLDPSRAE